MTLIKNELKRDDTSMKTFTGKALFLDRSDINTDEIIPAKYLTDIEKSAMKPHLLEDLKLPGFQPDRDIKGKSVVITRDNFGCGSSREHAPWALEVNNIYTVVASGFARIFRQNMFNCGMLAIELDTDIIDNLFDQFTGMNTAVSVDIDECIFQITSSEKSKTVSFYLSDFEKSLVAAGGWVNYADQNY